MAETRSPFSNPEDIPDRGHFGLAMEPVRLIGMTLLKIAGWRVEGYLPPVRKLVIIGGPHTSNWDFILLVLFALYFRTPTNWIGKDALFKPPLGWIMRRLGGIAVDRSRKSDTVSQVVDVINARDDLVLVVTPEGTRGRVEKWKSGFYWIAHGADIPITIFFADYKRRVCGFGPVVEPTGDYESDVQVLKDFMKTITPRHPDRLAKTPASSTTEPGPHEHD